MLSIAEATKYAEQHLAELSSNLGVELVIVGQVQLTNRGLLVNYNAQDWIINKNISKALAGNLPFLVDMSSGAIIFEQ